MAATFVLIRSVVRAWAFLIARSIDRTMSRHMPRMLILMPFLLNFEFAQALRSLMSGGLWAASSFFTAPGNSLSELLLLVNAWSKRALNCATASDSLTVTV